MSNSGAWSLLSVSPPWSRGSLHRNAEGAALPRAAGLPAASSLSLTGTRWLWGRKTLF